MAGKMKARSEEEIFLKEIIIEGIVGIQKGQVSREVYEKLVTFLPQSERKKLDKYRKKQKAKK